VDAELRFRAMGCDVHVLLAGARPERLDTSRELIDDLERRWSRFRADSEISLLNRRAGRPVRVSRQTVELVGHAVEGARVTAGRYNPTVLGAVLHAGYDRSFELLGAGPAGRAGHGGPGRRAHPAGSALDLGWERIVVDPVLSTVTLPRGVGFDPGGIGKGYAADLVVAEPLAEGAAGACVNVGGDLRVEGQAPGGGSWAVAVEHPLTGRPAAMLGLRAGGVATSSRTRRAWGPEGDRSHHLIDPATGRSASSGLASATVIAAQAWQAEVLAKAAFVAGRREGLTILEANGTEGLLIDDGGAVHPSATLWRFTSPALVAEGSA
jgi:thiamine biosynthesis lipoprotein